MGDGSIDLSQPVAHVECLEDLLLLDRIER